MKNIISYLSFSLSSSEKPLLEELWDYFVENYLESNSVYPNLGMDGTGSIISLTNIIFGIFFGVIIASIMIIYDKRVTGAFVRQMIYVGALDKENARTLSDLGYGERSNIAKSLRHSAHLRKVIKCVEEEDYYSELITTREEYEAKRANDTSLPEFKSVNYVFNGSEHYYIPEDKKYTAEAKFSKSGASWWAIPLTIILAFIGSFALMLILPYILTLLDQMIGSFKSM